MGGGGVTWHQDKSDDIFATTQGWDVRLFNGFACLQNSSRFWTLFDMGFFVLEHNFCIIIIPYHYFSWICIIFGLKSTIC